MKIEGMSAVSEFLGDFVVYRNLCPVDRRLPSLDTLRLELGLPAGMIPRKIEPEYAQVVAAILRMAREMTAPGTDIRRVVFLGDTRMLDGTAFANICTAGSWPGLAFIGSENSSAPKVDVEELEGGQKLFLSNRWGSLLTGGSSEAAVQSFPSFCVENGFVVDEHTALLIDLDKTAIGARGRNAGTIDGARVQAVYETVADLLGENFNAQAFRTAYDLIVQPEFHHFTEDNQDYVAYICLILGSGLVNLDSLVEKVRNTQMSTIRQFFGYVEENKQSLSSPLQEIHAEIYKYVLAGDPTPFKPFRYNEYRITVAQMGCMGEGVPLAELLKSEIVITGEVSNLAIEWKAKGALVFGLSDKPDEASLPRPGEAGLGSVPLHRKMTHVVSA